MRASRFLGVVLAALCVLSLRPAINPSTAEPNLPKKEAVIKDGWYECAGEAQRRNGETATYYGMTTVRKAGDKYIMRWIFDGSSLTGFLSGRAIRKGNSLFVGFSRDGQTDIIEYQIGEGKLTEESQPETLTFLKPFAKSEEDED